MEDFEKQKEEVKNPIEETMKEIPSKSEGIEYEEEIIVTKIS